MKTAPQRPSPRAVSETFREADKEVPMKPTRRSARIAVNIGLTDAVVFIVVALTAACATAPQATNPAPNPFLAAAGSATATAASDRSPVQVAAIPPPPAPTAAKSLLEKGEYIGRWSSSSGNANTVYFTVFASGSAGTFRMVASGNAQGYNQDTPFTASEAGEQILVSTSDNSFTFTLNRVRKNRFEGRIRIFAREISLDYLEKR